MGKNNKEFLKKYFTTDNKGGQKTKESHIVKYFDGLLDDIEIFIENSDFPTTIPFTQKLYNYLYDINKNPLCENCNNIIKWRNRFSEGYLINCSKSCRATSKKRLERMENTNLEKYGNKSISSVESIKRKKKKTFKEKYGHENIFQSKIVTEKTEKTMIERYGVKYALQSIQIKEKRKNNNLDKYGVENPSQLEFYKNKMRDTNIKKYGVSSVMLVPEIVNKNIKSSTHNTVLKYKEKLGHEVEINYKKHQNIEVLNQCKKHPFYIINSTLFYYRVLIHNIKNPCIECNPVSYNKSIKEDELKEFITGLGFKTIKKRIKRKEIDVYIENKNMGIEFNGLYWHSELFKENNYHVDKTNLMLSNNINLIQIFEDEWMHRQEIVKSIIKAKLGLINNKIYARKCQIKEISDKESKLFLDINHMQGNVNSKIKLGLLYKNELVSIMTFSKEKRKKTINKNIDEYELVRFSNKINTTVIGGASRLLNYFIKTYNPKFIITYADRRYSNGDLYETLGFDFDSILKPNFWYFNRKDYIRLHRFNFRKKNLIKGGFDETKTEKEIMMERGYLRIYDCGNIKYKMVLK